MPISPCIDALMLPSANQEASDAPRSYNYDGDLLFSVSKDQQICGWYSNNGERLGTYHGHQGAIWTVDVDPSSTILASGSADNTIRLWDVKTCKLLKTWELPTAVKRVEFNEDATKLLGVTEKRMGHLGTIVVYDVIIDPQAEQADEKALTIVCDQSKATVAGWSYLSKYIIAGHEDGSISQYDGKVRFVRGRCGRPCGAMLSHANNHICATTRRESSSTTSKRTTSTRPSRIFSGQGIARTLSRPLRTSRRS